MGLIINIVTCLLFFMYVYSLLIANRQDRSDWEMEDVIDADLLNNRL